MNLLLFWCLLLTLIYLSFAQKPSKACRLNKDADTCLMHLLLLGDPKFVFAENLEQMNKHCKQINGHEKCIKDYSSKCLASFPKQVTSVLAYGVAKTNKGYCTNKKRKDQFIALGKCANKLKPDGDTCMRQFIDDLQGIENYQEIKMKIPLACCNFHKMKACILSAVDKQGDSCSESNKDEVERIVDGYAFDVLQLLCGDYNEESDKCGNLLPKTPKKLSTQKRPKSMLMPFIKILSVEPK